MCVWLLFIVLTYKLCFGCLHLYNGNIICAVSVWFWIPMWISLKDSIVIWCMKMLLSLYKSKVKIVRCYWVFELLLVCFQRKILVKLVNTEKRERTSENFKCLWVDYQSRALYCYKSKNIWTIFNQFKFEGALSSFACWLLDLWAFVGSLKWKHLVM